jgi:hypothetical protein
MTRDEQGRHIVTCVHIGENKFEILYRFNNAQVVRQLKSGKDEAFTAFGNMVLFLRTKKGLKLKEIIKRG